ncbi:beta-galactosidase [Demequina aestuarii]|uniref:beta-galactosidase n=1 Tax=Demequina aestuarii TaxID=327095 RepID=UPI000782A7D4|nr:beta-galactosidase [Demequina aestuarii]
MFDSPSIRFGGDYNPEQWPEHVWDDDVRLMRGAHVTSATVGVFSWARLEPSPGEYDFAWLDEVLTRLHAGGIRVILATATASPPAWLARLHPESLPVTQDGTPLGFGSRQQYSPSSSAYRTYAMRLVREMAARYGAHPAVEAWHVGNEYGCHVTHSYDAESAEAFRAWLTEKYGTIGALNDAWGTAFWSQSYGDFGEVGVPAAAPAHLNPTQLLDFDRFSSDALLSLHREESTILREYSPHLPITTNFMSFFKGADYWQWAQHVDAVSDDSYPDPSDSSAIVRLSASRDLMRSLGGGKPWLLMEQATSAVNWRDRNAPKPVGLNRVQSLNAVARGADGICYFQWRQSQAGAEKFHSAMLPHTGEHTRIHREVQALGAELAGLDDIVGTRVPARVAIMFDWDSWWSLEQQAVPAQRDYVETVLTWYAGFLRRGVSVDFLRAGASAGGYDLVVAPLLHVASAQALDELAAVPSRGGTLVVSYQSGVLDPQLHAYLGGYLGGPGSALQGALGVAVEEFAPLPNADTRTAVEGEIAGEAVEWQEVIAVSDATVVASFADGFAAGLPAITRRADGDGASWYVGTQPDEELMDALVGRWLADARITAAFPQPEHGVETVERGPFAFVANHTSQPRSVSVHGEQCELAPFDAVLLRRQA